MTFRHVILVWSWCRCRSHPCCDGTIQSTLFRYMCQHIQNICLPGKGCKPLSCDMALKLFRELADISTRGTVDELSTVRVLVLLDGLKAASTQGTTEILMDIRPSALKALRVFRKHPERHVKESAKLVQRKWATVLVPSRSSLPPTVNKRRCDSSDGQISFKDYFAAMTTSILSDGTAATCKPSLGARSTFLAGPSQGTSC